MRLYSQGCDDEQVYVKISTYTRKHHLYNCLCKYCKKSRDKDICALSRKCKRRNTKKRRYTSKQWVKWTNTRERRGKKGAYYGKCK